MTARGKREAQRNASPLVTRKDFEWSTESAKYQRQLFRSFRACRSLRALTSGDAPHVVRRLPLAFILRAFGAPRRKIFLPSFSRECYIQSSTLVRNINKPSKKFRAAQKFWTVRLRRQQTSRGVRI